jgi:tryptophan synthase alpha subunit
MSQHKGTFPVMAHLVLGYPTLAASLETAEQYIAAGVQILELQIPFSHPTADGPVITAACQAATRQGVSVRDCIDAIGQLRSRHPQQEIMVMSYLNRLYTFGFQDFMAAIGRATFDCPGFADSISRYCLTAPDKGGGGWGQARASLSGQCLRCSFG